jgi:hypothetical protein
VNGIHAREIEELRRGDAGAAREEERDAEVARRMRGGRHG